MVNSKNRIAILPLGACEYHGPHLPYETDTFIVNAVVKRLSCLIPDMLNIIFLDVETVGYSVEHMHAKGTKTLSWCEAVERWISIGIHQYRKGVRKFVMLNAHGGNSPLMTIVATELRAHYNMLAVATGWTRFGLPEGVLSLKEQVLDVHAGFIETSVMLAIAPDKVNMHKAENFYNKQAFFDREFSYLHAYGKHAFGWLMRDLNPDGAAGNAQNANAVDGERMLTHATQGCLSLLFDVHHFDLDYFS